VATNQRDLQALHRVRERLVIQRTGFALKATSLLLAPEMTRRGPHAEVAGPPIR
jgi:hypothetical protein